MAKEIRVDIKENRILALDSTLLNILLKDNSSGKNIIWATDDYTQYDETYTKDRQITVFSVTGKNGTIIAKQIRVIKAIRQYLSCFIRECVWASLRVCEKTANISIVNRKKFVLVESKLSARYPFRQC